MRGGWLIVVLLGLIAPAGCAHNPPGNVGAVGLLSGTARRGHVYLLRGLGGTWSVGMDTMARQLQHDGVDASVFAYDQWRELAGAIANVRAPGRSRGPLVLVGHSYGADDAIRAARALGGRGVGIDLLVTIDPVTPPRVPPNVKRTINFYQSNGIWDLFPWFRGVPLEPEHGDGGGAALANLDLRRNRTDLLQPDTSHFNIAQNPNVQAEILREVLGICPMRPGVTCPWATAPCSEPSR